MSRIQPLLDNLGSGKDNPEVIDIIFSVWIDCLDASQESLDTEDLIQSLEYVRDTWDNKVVKQVAQKHIDKQQLIK